MKRAMLLLGLLLVGCHGDDDSGPGFPSALPNEVMCRDWDGNGPPILVEKPISDCDARRLHLCFVTSRTKKDCGYRRVGCYYGCPKDACHGD